jgi:hypothetical protein
VIARVIARLTTSAEIGKLARERRAMNCGWYGRFAALKVGISAPQNDARISSRLRRLNPQMLLKTSPSVEDVLIRFSLGLGVIGLVTGVIATILRLW